MQRPSADPGEYPVETARHGIAPFGSGRRRSRGCCTGLSSSRVLLTLWVAGLLSLPAAPTWAKDLKALSRYLSGAYFVEDLAQRCALLNPNFLRETAGPRGDISVYTSAFEAEIAKGLSPQEIAVVVLTAKKAGALVAANLLSDVASLAVSGKAGVFEHWCGSYVKKHVRGAIEMYEHKQEMYLGFIKRAKDVPLSGGE